MMCSDSGSPCSCASRSVPPLLTVIVTTVTLSVVTALPTESRTATAGCVVNAAPAEAVTGRTSLWLMSGKAMAAGGAFAISDTGLQGLCVVVNDATRSPFRIAASTSTARGARSRSHPTSTTKASR